MVIYLLGTTSMVKTPYEGTHSLLIHEEKYHGGLYTS